MVHSWVSFALKKAFWQFQIIVLSIFVCLMSYKVIWTHKSTQNTFSRGGGAPWASSYVKSTKKLMSSSVKEDLIECVSQNSQFQIGIEAKWLENNLKWLSMVNLFKCTILLATNIKILWNTLFNCVWLLRSEWQLHNRLQLS